jgi:NHL repeat
MADQFSVTHCIVPGNDGLLYVCDRVNSRIQVFKKDGTFVREVVIGEPPRPSDKTHLGAAWSVAFSPDKEQRFMYVADGTSKKIWILRHSDLKVLGSFGRGGRQGGQFQTIHCLAVDSTEISTPGKHSAETGYSASFLPACRRLRLRSSHLMGKGPVEAAGPCRPPPYSYPGKKTTKNISRLRVSRESDDTHATYRVAGFETLLTGRI